MHRRNRYSSAIKTLEWSARISGIAASIIMLLMVLSASLAGLIQLALKYKQALHDDVLDWLIPIAQAQWVNELPQFFFGWIFLLGAAYTLQTKGHVRIDIVYNKLSLKTQAVIDLLGIWLLLLPMCVVFVILGYDLIINSIVTQEGASQIGGIPKFWYKIALLPFPILLSIQALADTLRALTKYQQAQHCDQHSDQTIC